MRGTTNIPVVGVIFRKDNKILFLMRKNTAWMDGFYGVPGGHVEAGESFKQAACREAREEVGLEVQPDQLKAVLTFHKGPAKSGDIRAGIAFEATGWKGEPQNLEPDKHDHIAWLEADNLPDNVIPETVRKIELIKAGQTYWEFDWD